LEESASQGPPTRQRNWRISSAGKVVFVQVTPQRIVTVCFRVPLQYSYSLTWSPVGSKVVLRVVVVVMKVWVL